MSDCEQHVWGQHETCINCGVWSPNSVADDERAEDHDPTENYAAMDLNWDDM